MITVYTKPSCAPCQTLKHWLKTNNVDYAEKNVEDPTILDEMIRITGMMSVPQTLVGDTLVTGPNVSYIKRLISA